MRPFQSALVTGATGFIGSALVGRLLVEGVDVTCLVRSKMRRLSPLARWPGIRVIEVPSFEVAHLKAKLANFSAEVIFHLASSGVQPEDRDPGTLMEGNIGLITWLLQAVANWPLRRFIHTGSCSEYGFSKSNGTPISESEPLRPTSLYGAAKAASVLWGTALATHMKIPFLTLRLFGVFGTHEGRQRLLPYLIDCLQRDQPADLTPGEQVRDFLFEDDVAGAYVEAAKAEHLNHYEVYNVCSGCPLRIRDLAEAVADELNKPRHLLHWGKRPYRRDEPMWLVGDNRKFVTATGWQPRVSIDEGIRRMSAKFAATSPVR